jgi:hypothetical protein
MLGELEVSFSRAIKGFLHITNMSYINAVHAGDGNENRHTQHFASKYF